MSDLYLDPATHDIAIDGAGSARLTVDIPEAAAQALVIDLSLFTGEWFLDLNAGVPYYRDVLKQHPDIESLRVLFRDRVARQRYVTGVSSVTVSIDRAARALSVEFSAQLVSGDELTVLLALGLLDGLLASTGVLITVNGSPIGLPS